MENKNEFSHVIYEVIDSEVQKYSSTAVHGGERGASVQSTTTFHSDQGVWVRDVSTGREQKFEFENFNIAVRPTHKIACVWHSATNELEGVLNISTDRWLIGVHNFSEIRLCTWTGIVFMSLLLGIIFLIPFLGAFVCFLCFLLGSTPVCSLKTKLIKGYRIGLLVAALAYVWLGLETLDHFRSWDHVFQFMKTVFIFNLIVTFSGYTVANNYVKNGRSHLKGYMGGLRTSHIAPSS